MLFTTQQHWPWCLIQVDGHLHPRAQQHNPHWQQTSLSTNDSQHVSGGTPAFKQQRLTQQQELAFARRAAAPASRDGGVAAMASRASASRRSWCICRDAIHVVAAELTSDAAARLREIRVRRGVAAQTAVD